jgi:putative spermidine/putrescine transport system permease protein
LSPRVRAALGLAPAVGVTVALFGAALAGTVRASLEPGLDGRLDTSAWRALAADPVFADALWFTLRVAVLSTLLAAVLAFGAVLLFAGRGTFSRALVTLPVPVPHLVVAAVAVLWLAPGGLADRLLGGLPVDLVRDPWGLGIVAVYAVKEAPFLVLLMLAAMGRAVHERAEAAATLGLGPIALARHVVWPAVRAPLAVGCLIVLAFVVGAFEVPLVVGPTDPPMLATYALDAVRVDLVGGQARAAAALLVAALLSVALAVACVQVARGRRD